MLYWPKAGTGGGSGVHGAFKRSVVWPGVAFHAVETFHFACAGEACALLDAARPSGCPEVGQSRLFGRPGAARRAFFIWR